MRGVIPNSPGCSNSAAAKPAETHWPVPLWGLLLTALHWQTRREGALLPLKGVRGTPVTTHGRAVLPRHDDMLGLGWSGSVGD